MLNPVNRVFGMLIQGPGTFYPSFGIPLNPEAQNSPAFTRSMEIMLRDPVPDPVTSGLLPQIRDKIINLKAHLPVGEFKIAMRHIPGPFNMAHDMIGEEAMLAPIDAPEQFSRLMERITTFLIETRHVLHDWIGEDWLYGVDRVPTISECSVNLVSREFYEEHILPHDRRIVHAFGEARIHPCSGPHVFHATLENLPNVTYTEAGFIAKTAAGSISVDEALAAIGNKPITLHIGHEPPEGGEYECIRRDLDRYDEHPRLLFGYTGMHWRKKDRPLIRDLHQRLDAYWVEKFG